MTSVHNNQTTQHRTPAHPGAKTNTDREWCRELGRAYEVYHKRAKAIGTATASGKRLQPIVRNFLRTPQVNLIAAYKALGGNADPDQVRALSGQVDAWATEYPPIRWYPKAKPNGSSRPICILPPELKAVHYLIKEVISQQIVPDGIIFGIPNASRDDLAIQLKQLQNSGYVYLAKTDVIDCFQSINPDALYSLPLPKEVTRQALDTRSPRFLETCHPNHASQANQDFSSSGSIYDISHNVSGPKGLIQGSPSSSIILAHLLVGLPDSEDVRVMLCYDNIVIAARTPSGSRAMADTLAAHFERCPAGPLAMCETEFADNTPLDFLGYRFNPKREDIGIAEDALSRLEKHLGNAEREDLEQLHALREAYDQVTADPAQITPASPLLDAFPVDVWRTLRDWRAGFPAANANGQELSHYLNASADAAALRGQPIIEHLHSSLFAEPETWEHDAIRAILKRHTNQNRPTPEYQ